MSDSQWASYGWQSTEVPKAPLSDEERRSRGVPLTLRPIPDPGVIQRSVFEPALKQYARAYRAGEPSFADGSEGRRWFAARRRAVDVVLAAIAGSPYADSLVLRGSVLLRAWYGSAAREPGDLDFVVVPSDWGIEEDRTTAMLDEIAREAGRLSANAPVRIEARGAVSDAIWTYDRVPGRRLMLPWEGPGDLPGGWVQLDFVFNELLPVAPESTVIPAADHEARTTAGEQPGPALLAATAELSLAWKIMWLTTDDYPQGKDLYDAVLLAERTPLRLEVLRAVFEHAPEYYRTNPVGLTEIAALETEWDQFKAEYPHQPSTDQEYVRRLTDALAPTFTSGETTSA